MPSVVVPAHNEETVLGRLLDLIATRDDPQWLQIIVVCNGCTDRTELVARTYPRVDVVIADRASKAHALRLGNERASDFPRIFVDADVEVDRAGIYALCRALEGGSTMAAAPTRQLELSGSSLPVRMYYALWQDLPSVREGLFGRGVVALSQEGYARLSSLPDLIADDLAVSSAFHPHERRVVDEAVVVIHTPRTWPALIRRRVRAAAGTQQFYADAATESSVDSRTTWGDLLTALRHRPSNIVRLPVFLAAAALSRRGARVRKRSSGDPAWERDDSRDV